MILLYNKYLTTKIHNMPHVDHHSKPFQKEIFRYILTAFFVILVIINFAVYYTQLNTIYSDAKSDLKKIAENVAENVSYISHEKILTNDQQKSEQYREIVGYFKDVMDGNPLIDDIYTLRPTSDPNTMTFVVSASETQDLNNDNYIDEAEIKPEVGERYDVTGLEQMKNGLIEPSVDNKINADKWGQWLSGYAPIVNDKGETVALLGVDIAATDIVDHRRSVGIPLLYVDIAMIPLILLFSFIIARFLAKPFKTLAIGMQRVVHGELDYRLPLAGSKTEIMFEKLFNNMLGMYDNVIKQFKKNKDDDFSN